MRPASKALHTIDGGWQAQRLWHPKPESLDDAGAACSECGDRRSYVTITAEDIRCVDRIRTCLDCGHVWDTVEFPESDLTQDGPPLF